MHRNVKACHLSQHPLVIVLVTKFIRKQLARLPREDNFIKLRLLKGKSFPNRNRCCLTPDQRLGDVALIGSYVQCSTLFQFAMEILN